ncbi:hypothetical protein GCM10023116_11340 [Kistimonas scapharcae]|uniref:Uncharacterized protein n=1 Tax=Kistimonas scapharcae TaxID=1036133 RepID=A0ABP8V192_9GAMM
MAMTDAIATVERIKGHDCDVPEVSLSALKEECAWAKSYRLWHWANRAEFPEYSCMRITDA